ncbi:hypothetical protein [Mesorhizobium sp. CAU 1741]|uniref:hypothetical protein n=1 Tax=Mesorhizobium sp. CAU 1741 TaxID=3140366 RepID=UPI00325BA173
MHSTVMRRFDADIPTLPERARRNVVSVSPVAATVLLTAAVFLLPAPSDQRPARASIDEISVSATHIQLYSAARRDMARR